MMINVLSFTSRGLVVPFYITQAGKTKSSGLIVFSVQKEKRLTEDFTTF